MTGSALRTASRFPTWMGSIRFRLTLLYSLFLFGLASIVVGVIYAALARTLEDEPVSQDYTMTTAIEVREDVYLVLEETMQAELPNFEAIVNERALEKLRDFSYLALAGLFIGSLGVGWLVAGRVLSPLGRITSVAKEIEATDLSQRIDLAGPHDELRELADTFDHMLERLDDAFSGQRQFIQEASHELRNPLAVIRANLDVALADPDATAEDLRETSEIVGRSAERMTRLVDDLLTYAHQGDLMRSRTRVDLGRVVEDVAMEFVAPAEANGLRVEISTGKQLGVMGDPDALRRALANLLANAVRLAPADSKVTVSAGYSDGWVWMAVADEGPGIPDEDQERVFQRFWRGDVRSSRREGRSGLGLTIVREVAETHKGLVGLESAVGEGSIFSIWLPAVAGAASQPPEAVTREIPVLPT